MCSRRVVAVLGSLLVNFGCADDPEAAGECGLPDDPQFEVTTTTLQTDASHMSCPTDVPTGLGSDDIESEGVCAQTISGCAIHLTCDVEGFVLEGKLGERDGLLVGRVELTQPIKCVYELSGKFL